MFNKGIIDPIPEILVITCLMLKNRYPLCFQVISQINALYVCLRDILIQLFSLMSVISFISDTNLGLIKLISKNLVYKNTQFLPTNKQTSNIDQLINSENNFCKFELGLR